MLGLGIGLHKNNFVSANVAPFNTITPVISGTATVGSILTSTTGTWEGTAPITYTYQWLRNGVNISGATSSTYTLVSADIIQVLRCKVIATNSVGSVNALSNELTERTLINFQARVAADSGTFEAEECPKDSLPALIENNPSLCITPNAVKAGKLYSIVPTDGTGDLTVTRATSATRVNSSGLIENVGANIARLNYTNESCPSILVEPQRTNLLLQSEMFTIGWTSEGATISANTTTSPDGNLTADTLTEGTMNDVHRIYRNALTTTSGVNYTSSIFVKKDTARYFRLSFIQANSNSVWVSAQFDLDTKTFTSGVGSGGGTFVSASIIELSSGWFRVSLVASVPSTTANILYCLSDGTAIISSQSRGCPSYLGNINNKIFIWGAQLELGSNATSYIPTTTSSVTRNADVISKTGISSLIGQTEGVIYIQTLRQTAATGSWICRIDDAAETNKLGIYLISNGNLVINITRNNVSIDIMSYINFLNLTNQGNAKIALAYKNGDFALAVNGTIIATSSNSGAIPSMSAFRFSATFGTSVPNQLIGSALLFPTRLTNTQLQQLTTL